MANQMNGIFKGSGLVLEVKPEAKSYDGIIDNQSNVKASGLSALFARATSESSGSAIMKRSDIVVTLKYDYAKNIVTMVDVNGSKITFCYQFDKLFMLDPNGEETVVLSR